MLEKIRNYLTLERKKILSILLQYSLCAALIYFHLKGIWVEIPLSIILFFWSLKNLGFFKKKKNLMLLILGLILLSSNNVYAQDLKPEEIISYLDNYMVLQGNPDWISSNYNHILLTYDKNAISSGLSYTEYELIYYNEYDLEHKYNWQEEYYYYIVGPGCISFNFNILDDSSFFVQSASRVLGGSSHTPYPGDEIGFDVLYSTKDIKFEREVTVDGWPSVQGVTIYSVEENEIINNFGSNLGNVDGYTYITIPPRSQVVLYPKILQAFDFYLFYTGSIDIDILDTVGSNIASSNHIDGLSSSTFTYKKVSYLEEDANNKRGVYLSNFNSLDTAVVVGYDSNLFELLTFENGTATSIDKTITFNNTYDLIKNHNNIVDNPNGMLGESSFENIAVTVKDALKQFIAVFSVIGSLFYMFFNVMPPVIGAGLQIIFVFTIAYIIIRIVRG